MCWRAAFLSDPPSAIKEGSAVSSVQITRTLFLNLTLISKSQGHSSKIPSAEFPKQTDPASPHSSVRMTLPHGCKYKNLTEFRFHQRQQNTASSSPRMMVALHACIRTTASTTPTARGLHLCCTLHLCRTSHPEDSL